ncbi:Ig-like domain-containing protein [Terribacillus saccharophilus]|uniref:Ig-like domain-containing protein n=1 Tax=Terribacillus saccharophilus TaxID=361277 RepID=UPI00398299C8
MSKRKDYDHKKNMQRKNKLRMAKRSSALLAAAAIVVTPYVYDSEQKTLSKYTAEAANIAVLGNQTLGATYQDGVLTLRLRGNQLANIGVLNNYSPNFQLPAELSSLLQNPNIRSQTTISYSIPYAGVGGIALNNTGSVTGSRLTVNTATNSIGTNIQHTLGVAVSSPTTFTARINLANLGITELPTASDGRLDFRAIATDTLIANVDLLNSQGTSTYISTGVSDTQPPAAPVLNAVDSDDTTLSGTAEANSTINITLPDGSTATATTDANGNWSTAIPAQQPGGTISATATDAAGNRSAAGTSTVTNADTEAPAAPVINPVDSEDTTVSGTAEAGSTITLTLGDGSTAEAVTDDAGNWSADIPAQAADSTITAVATDDAGNDSDSSSVTVTDGDTEAPAAPEIAPIDSDDTTISGTAEAGSAITITLEDGTTVETETDENGNWSADIPEQEADSAISVTATDAAGNQSDPGTVTVTNAGGGADTEPPDAPVIAPVTDEDTTLSGSAEANADIIVTLPDGTTAETTADGDGNWTVDIPVQASDSEITAIAIDEAGNESENGIVTVTDADSEAPAAPEINPVDSDDTSLSGTAEANADIIVTLPDGSTVETTADADGNWTVDIPAQAAESEITAVAVDEVGNESDAGSVTVADADADTEAPAAPEVNPVDSDDTSLSGTAEPNTDITVTLPDGSVVETAADADGSWTIDIPAQETGSVISVTATDEAGNESDAGSVTITNADTEAPVAPEVDPVDSDDTSVSGTAEPNSDIELTFSDGTTVETRTDADGNWSVEIPPQEPGSEISVVAIDDAGNRSNASTVVVINYDSTPPAAPEINPVNSADTTLTGTAEPNADIVISLPDGSEVDTTADADGNWSVDIPAQDPGGEISAIAIDEAGNQSGAGTVTVTNADTTAPDAPAITPVDSDDTSLSGTAEANTDIIVTLPDGTALRTTTDADGNWSVDIPVQDPGAVLSVVAVDEARNISAASTVNVTDADTTAPDAPEINPVDSDDTTLSGTAEANADIIVTLPGGSIISTTADDQGNWAVDIPVQDPGAVLSVVAVDEARNISGASTVSVTNADTAAPDAPEINPVDSDDTFLSGTAEANADIIVTLPDGSSISTTADDQGNWSVSIPTLDPGAVLSVVAVDAARNVSDASTVSVTNGDTTSPDAPELDPIDSDDTSLSGIAEANADIIVTLPDGSTIGTTADDQGNWAVDIPAQDPGAVLSVVAVDEARNISAASTVSVTNADITAPDAPEINPVDSDDTSLSGSAEANADILITLPDGSTISTTANDQGNWAVDIPAQDPGAVLSVVAVDEARNISSASTVGVTNADTTAPDAPVVNPVDSDDTSLSGTAEPDASIIVTLPDGTAVRTNADADGNWTVDIPAQDPGAVLSVAAVDAAQNASGPSTVSVTNADTTAPDAPGINPADSDDTSLSGTAEPLADVIVTLPDGSALNTTADADGNWTVDIPAQDPGAVLSVVAVDEARNISGGSTITITNADITAPDAPEVDPADSDDTSLSGTAEPNADIVVTLPNGSTVRTTADADGNWEVDIPAQDPGAVLSVVAVDEARNVSGAGTITITNSDTTAPDAPVVNPADSDDTSLSGTAEANAEIIVTLPDGLTIRTTADEQGDWSVEIPAQNPGAALSVVAVDAARNISGASTINVTNADTTAPDAPEVNPVASDDTTLSGTAEANATIIVTLPDGSNAITTADDAGGWSVAIPALNTGDNVSVAAVDAARNISDSSVVTVVAGELENPAPPIVGPVTDDDSFIFGLAGFRSYIFIYLPDGTVVETRADDQGQWSAEIPTQEAGSEISILETDENGNSSEPTVITVSPDTEAPATPIALPLSNTDTALSGIAEPETTVVVSLPDGTQLETVTDVNGNWTLDIPAQEAGDELSVVSVDAAGNQSASQVVIVTDNIQPEIPTVDPVTDTDTSLSGDAEPDAAVVITLPDGSVAEAPVDGDGNWEAEIPAQESGEEITVVVTDPAGNVSNPIIVPVENSDTEAPDAPAVDPVSDADTSLSGDAEPDATVVITLPDGATVEAPVDGEGNWEAEIPAQGPGEEITVVVTDPAGNISDPVIVPVENSDIEAPDVPAVDPVTDEDTSLSGDAEPDATVIITLPDDAVVEAPVDGDGNWEAEIPVQEAGDEITVVVTDPAGNLSDPVIVPVENSDTEAPDVPAVDPVTDEDTSLSGGAEPDATVVITLPDDSVIEAPVDADGSWEADIPSQEPGDEITLVIVDPAGNISEPVVVPVESSDTDAPEAPVVDPVTDADTALSGDGETGSTVVITLPDGTTSETPVNEDGSWEAEIPAQEPGDEIIVVVTDPAGNVSNPVVVPVENSDTDAPDVPVVDPVTDADTALSGDAEPDATVVITLPDGSIVEAPVDSDGNWEAVIPVQEPGDLITVVVTDPAGNISNPVIVPVENSDTDAPEVPVVDPVTDADTALSGDAEPDSTVVITLPDGSSVEAPVDSNGSWEAEIPAQEPGEEITVVVTDPVGNVSNPVIVPVENSDTDAPGVPVVDPVTDADTSLSGDAEPDSTVVITLPDGSTVEAPVDGDGNWEAEIPVQEHGDIITVVVRDPAGNVSNPVIVPVENSDTEAPDVPIVDAVTENDDTISGDGEPGSTVVITLPDDNTVEAPVDEDGNWEAEIPALEPGDEIIVVVTDPAGNVSDPVVVPVENENTDTPAPPSVEPVTEDDDTISGDGEPGSTVVITLPDGTTVETPIDEDGNWEAEIPSQEPGDEVIVVITDPENGVSDPVIVPIEEVETDIPVPPSVDPIDENDDTISGDGEPGSTVIITLPDGTTVETPVDEDGNWETDIPSQEPGDEVVVVITDPEGNESDPAVVPVEEGETDTSTPPSVDPIDEEDDTISGGGTPGSTIIITLPDGTIVEVPVDEDGSWETDIPALESGNNVTVVETDPEGNESKPAQVTVGSNEGSTSSDDNGEAGDVGAAIVPDGSVNDAYGGSQLPQTSNNFFTSILISAGALIAGAISLVASRFRRKNQ